MLQHWEIAGKKGNIAYPKGEVVYQTKGPNGGKGVVIEPIYETPDGTRFIQDAETGELLEVLTNPFNGYCYRQDGK
ncbi:hypothetical protein CEB3_c13500 [Peptococcaceae bacterium CEB3]|nr:hypothetical protein CEB3_c13500 [Peptococcaceae bacterium CEB3]